MSSRVIKNSIYLLSRTLLMAFIGLYTVRELLNVLGVEAFGIYNLVFGIVGIFLFVNGALISATQRYLAYEIGLGLVGDVKKVFLSSIVVHFLVALIVCLIMFFIKDIFIYKILNIDKYVLEAEYIYICSIFSVFLLIMQVPFTSLITAHEEMHIFAYVSLMDASLKLISVYVIGFYFFDKMKIYASLITVITFVIFILYFLFCLYRFKNILKINGDDLAFLKHIDFSFFKFAGWSAIGNLAVAGKNQGSNIVINMFFPVFYSTAFSVSITVTGFVTTLIFSISNAINPQIYKKYAQRKMDDFFKLINFGTKYYMLFLTLIIFPNFFAMDYLINLWLNNAPNQTYIFCILSLVIIILEAFSFLIITGIQATGNVRKTQIFVGSILLLNVPLSYFFYNLGFSVYSVFFISIFLTLISFFVRIMIFVKLTNYDVISFLLQVLKPVIIFQLLVLIVQFVLFRYLGSITNIFEFISYNLISFLINIFMVLIFVLDSNELLWLRKKIKSKFS